MNIIIACVTLLIGLIAIIIGITTLRIIKNIKNEPKPFTISKNIKDPNIIAESKLAQNIYYQNLINK